MNVGNHDGGRLRVSDSTKNLCLFIFLSAIFSGCNFISETKISDNFFKGASGQEGLLDGTNVISEDSITDFITTWETTVPGESIALPLPDLEYRSIEIIGSYKMVVDWGDGSTSEIDGYDDLDKTHSYADIGVYTVKISGSMPAWSFNQNEYIDKIQSVEQWGYVGVEDFNAGFSGCSNLTINATDGDGLYTVMSMSYMFMVSGVGAFDAASWNTSNVTTMRFMFNSAISANPDTSGWDTSSVTDMHGMFYRAHEAIPNTSGWDTSKVTFMSSMFYQAYKANPDVSGDDWNTENVTSMSEMFMDATTANPDTSGWDISSVSDMTDMFDGAIGVDQISVDTFLSVLYNYRNDNSMGNSPSIDLSSCAIPSGNTEGFQPWTITVRTSW